MTDAGTKLDVLGVGNAIVDVLSRAEDSLLAEHDIPKGGMILIDEDRAAKIYAAMAPGVEISGGSAANSIACVASLGGKGGFVGKVRDDALGEIFRHDLQAIGVEFATAAATDGPGTARCLVNVTPDAQRSMSTFLGAAGGVTEADVDEAQVRRAKILFFEGYLFEQPEPRKAFVKACAVARAAGVKTALTLSDAGCVERQHAAFLDFIRDNVDILLANENEACALLETQDVNDAAARVNELVPLAAITRSEHGAIICARGESRLPVPAVPPTKLVDTTGAGDAYAAGFLYGLSQDFDPARASAVGAVAAAEIISHYGARPETSLLDLAKEKGVLA